MTDRFKEKILLFQEHNGILRTTQALNLGISSRDLYTMKDAGMIEQLSRGVYQLSTMQSLSYPDLTAVAIKIPHGVICLISALAFHQITTQIPHEVYIALKAGTEKPRFEYPPTQYFWVSEPAFSSGVETYKTNNIPLKIYLPEKTIADCFKFRNRVGLDVALEALKLWRERKGSKIDDLMNYAKICRVEKIMKPYIEAIL